MNDTATAPDTATMQRYDCPIHSGPLVVLEDYIKPCGCHAGPRIAMCDETIFTALPIVLPAMCVRRNLMWDSTYCSACFQTFRTREIRFATRPYVEEAVLS